MDHVPSPPIVSHLVEVLKDPRRAKNLVAACLQNYPADFVPRTDIQILVCVAGFLAGGELKERCDKLLVRFAESSPNRQEDLAQLAHVYAALDYLQIASSDPRRTELLELLWPNMGRAIRNLVMPLAVQSVRDLEALEHNGFEIVDT